MVIAPSFHSQAASCAPTKRIGCSLPPYGFRVALAGKGPGIRPETSLLHVQRTILPNDYTRRTRQIG